MLLTWPRITQACWLSGLVLLLPSGDNHFSSTVYYTDILYASTWSGITQACWLSGSVIFISATTTTTTC